MATLLSHLSPGLVIDVVRAILWLSLGLLLWLWLRGELTPARFLTIFESEEVLSIRLILAAVWSVFIMCMLAAQRINVEGAVRLNSITELLLSYGIVKAVGKAWAGRGADKTDTKTDKTDNSTTPNQL